MHRTPRLTFIAVTVVLALAGSPAPPASGPAAASTPPATIEPTLPLAIDLRFESLAPDGTGGRAILVAEIVSDRTLHDLSLRLVLPDGVAIEGPDPFDAAHGSLAALQGLRLAVPLRVARHAPLPIRVEASFRLEDGRAFRTLQGETLDLGQARPPGRSHAGAYEVMGVPLEDLGR